MKIKKIANRTNILIILILLTIKFNSFAQNVTVSQDPKFEQLLNEKRKINSGITLSATYKIQILSGTTEESKKNLIAFKKAFKDYDGTLIFSTPNYKVIVGNFKTRIDAERNLAIIKKSFPNALLIKPNR